MTNTINSKNNTNILLQFAIFLFLLNSLFKYFMPSMITKALPVISLFLVLLSCQNKIIYLMKRIHILYICFGFIWFIGCIYSTSFQKAFGYVSSFFLSLLFAMMIATQIIDIERIVYFLGTICFVFSFFVILQPIIPQLIDRIVSFLPYTYDQKYEMNYWSTRLGMYSGIFPDRAATAFYSCILIGCGIFILFKHNKKLISNFKKIVGAAFLIVGVLSLLMTAKRGHLVAAAIALLFVYITFKKAHHKSIAKIVIASVILVSAAFFIVTNLDAAKLMIERFTDNDNFYTNRLDIYGNIYNQIEEHILLGTGTASAYDILGIGGHNIYLTVFMENGIFGFILIIVCVLCSMIYTWQVIYHQSKQNQYECLPNLLFALFIQIFFVIYGFSGNPLYDNYIFYIYIFSIAITQNSEIMSAKKHLTGGAT